MENISTKTSGIIQDRMDLHIYYEDTDLSGFVYHANYLKYFERAREHLIGIDYLSSLLRQGIHFVVSKAELSYVAPAHHGDLLAILSAGRFSRSPAVPFTQTAYLVKNNKLAHELVKAQITLVALNKENRPIRMPDSVVNYFLSRTI